MEINIKVPTSLNEITLKQYKKFLSVQEKNDDPNFIQAKMMEIFCGVSHKFASLMKYSDVEKITGSINEMFLEKPALITSFKLNGKEYGFIPKLDDMTLGEYIDLDSFTGDYDTIEIAMNVLYRPIKHKLKNKYTIQDYDPKTKEDLLNMPMDAVVSSLFFFLNLGMELSEITLNSLKINPPVQLAELQRFQQSMDGFSLFLPYLKETLLELKISQN